MGIPYSLNVHFILQTQPALGNLQMYNRWTIMDLTFPKRFQDELQMHTKAPDADNLKSQRSQWSEAICNYCSAASDPHLAANLVLSYSQGFRRNKSRKRSSRLLAQLHKTNQKSSKVLWFLRKTGPGVKSIFAHSPPRKMIVKYLPAQCPHNWLHCGKFQLKVPGAKWVWQTE